MYKQLTSEQRYYIYLRKQAGSTQKSIAEAMGVMGIMGVDGRNGNFLI